MTTRLFFSSSDSPDHLDHISARQGDARYVNEDELAPKGAQHFLTKPVTEHLDMHVHLVTNVANGIRDSDAATLEQVRMASEASVARSILAAHVLRRVKRGTLSSPDGIKLFILFKCTSCIPLSLLVSRPVFSARYPTVYFVLQQMPVHVTQMRNRAIVFFPYFRGG